MLLGLRNILYSTQKLLLQFLARSRARAAVSAPPDKPAFTRQQTSDLTTSTPYLRAQTQGPQQETFQQLAGHILTDSVSISTKQ